MRGYVYLICDPETELYKIGVTRGSLENRIKKLQTGNGAPLHVTAYHMSEYPYRVETMLHNRYANKRELNEWFRLDDSDVLGFNSVCGEVEETIKFLSDNPFFMKKIH